MTTQYAPLDTRLMADNDTWPSVATAQARQTVYRTPRPQPIPPPPVWRPRRLGPHIWSFRVLWWLWLGVLDQLDEMRHGDTGWLGQVAFMAAVALVLLCAGALGVLIGFVLWGLR